jgi:inner membrane protein
MQKPLLFKTFVVFILTLLIAVPLALIQSTISERMRYRDEAVHSIATDSVREQTVIGPLLVIPYTDEYQEEQPIGETQKIRIIKHSESRRLVVFPNELRIKGNFDTDHRYRGIHKVLVYTGHHNLSGDFVMPRKADIRQARPDSKITMGQPYIALSIEDVRGIRNVTGITWDGKQVEFQQGSNLPAFLSGLHAPIESIDLAQAQAQSIPFNFDLQLDGIERMHFSPVAKNNHVTLTSKWPHPQFGGRFLPSPKARVINDQGFSATWNISALATSAQQQLAGAAQYDALVKNMHPDYFSVGFIEPINIYSQADRAIKYGLLFVALTFAAFFLFELLKKIPVHPVQYTLVGLALALFFLLLVSLSEHLSFLLAYLVSSGACILLIGFYLSYVLHNWKRGFGFGAALTMLYGVLYGLLNSENNALVMGSILLFAVLAAIMIATRTVDWYQMTKTDNPVPQP